METFTKLFGSLLVLVYHCFDRIVINGYLSGLARPQHGVYFFGDVVGVSAVDKTALSQRTEVNRNWGEDDAANPRLPSSGPKKASARRITWRPICAGW